jgi:hypothetical protein
MFISDEDILSLFLSEMGIKEAFIGDTSIYRRDPMHNARFAPSAFPIWRQALP